MKRPSLNELFRDVTGKAMRNHQYKLKEVGNHLGLCYSAISVIAERVDRGNKP